MISTPNRNRRAVLWIGGAAVAAVLGTAVPALALGSAPAKPAPASSGSSVPAAAVAAKPSREAAALRRLVTGLAAEAHGTVQVTEDAELRQATALVTTPAGAFEIGALVDDDPDGVANWTESCDLDADGADGRTCTALVERPTLGVWDRSYPAQPGRRTLTAAATTKAGGTLTLVISNLTETGPGGAKVIGPNWRKAGITVAEVRAALAATGLTAR